MIIRQTDIHSKHLSKVLLESKIFDEAQGYKNGFSWFVTEFFNLFNGMVLIYIVDPGIYDINLPEIVDSTLDFLDSELHLLSTDQKTDFLLGVSDAIDDVTKT